jgi:hypothetical protein
VPEGRWRTALLAAAVAALLAAGGLEATWRSLGHLPTVDGEDLELWGALRRRASNESRDTLVLLGKSRAHMDLDVATIEQRYPQATVVQLALRGRGAWATLADLAADARFKGRVLFSMTEPDLVRQERGGQQPAVDRAHTLGPDAHLNALVRAALGERFVIRSHELRPQRVLRNAAHGRTPTPQFMIVGADRRAYADFSRIDVGLITRQVEAVQQQSAANMRGRRPNPRAWLQEALEVRSLVEQIRSRGGDVVFLHLPVSGSSARFSETFYPKALFWDVFAQNVGARTLHYRDEPSLAGFVAPDTSHLDKQDAPRFTAALLDTLAARGFLPR